MGGEAGRGSEVEPWMYFHALTEDLVENTRREGPSNLSYIIHLESP